MSASLESRDDASENSAAIGRPDARRRSPMLSPLTCLGVAAVVVLVAALAATGILLRSGPGAAASPSASQIAALATTSAEPASSSGSAEGSATLAPSPGQSEVPSAAPSAASQPGAASPAPTETDAGGDGCGSPSVDGPISPPVADPPAVTSIAAGHFGPAGAPVRGGGYDSATLLHNGKVLFVGGGSPDTMAVLYDPATDEFAQTGSLVEGRHHPLAVLLANGNVLVAGGTTGGCAVGLIDSVEIYNSATGHFTSLGSPMAGAMYESATMLASGKVLFAGGQFMDEAHPDGGASAELFDPSTNKFGPTGTPSRPHTGGTVTALPDNTVLFAGGGSDADPVSKTAELYRPDHGDFVAVSGAMTTSRVGASATLLSDGLVLIAGGSDVPSAELYNPATGKFTATSPMTRARTGQTATLLPGNKVLLTGDLTPTNTAEVFGGGAFTATPGSMAGPHSGATATLLPNGRVLIVGGGSAELYQP